jgi:hypothetical protein
VPVTIPLFPLENVVLLPDGVVPLHIFEPRYRQMTEHALAGDRHLGMIAVRTGGSSEMAGEPPLFEIGCAGFIAEHQRSADGRFQLLLRATERFRVLRELPREPGRLYRVAEIEQLQEDVGDAEAARRARDQVLDLLVRLTERRLGPKRSIDSGPLRALGLARFATSVAQSLALPTREKQSLLEAATLAERLERLAGALDFHLALLDRSAGGGPETLH